MEAGGTESPTAHVGHALPFLQIELAALQLLRVAARLFFRSLSFLNIHARAVPLNDVAAGVAQRHFAVEHPVVITIRPADPCFVLEYFSAGQAGSPFGQNAVDVIWMNERSPIPAGDLVQ